MQPMNVLVIDGQGGGLGKQLVAALSTQCPEIRLTAVGTNSLAANAMRKAGAPRAATGENAVVVNCRSADIIVGPIGIVIADALLGEITPAMATAVCQSHAMRVLIPVNHCENYIVGVPEQPISDLVAAAVQKVKALCAGEGCGKRVYWKMPSACALGIFSGKISYNRATADSLRAVRCCIFTERVQEGNLICLCLLPAETAAWRQKCILRFGPHSRENENREHPQMFPIFALSI